MKIHAGPFKIFAILVTVVAPVSGAPSPAEVIPEMKRASTFFSGKVAHEGGYVYYYSPDLEKRLGEGVATATEVWVQPPGTPTVGEALLNAHEATGDAYYLEAALKAGRSLVYGQLESGGWRNSIEYDASGPRIDQYRNGKGKGNNFSTLDDDITQSALRFLMRLDSVAGFNESDIHEAVDYTLKALLAAQYPNGAFPQGWTGPVEARPVATASMPDYDWRTEGRIKEYWNEYTLNDGLAGTVTDTLISAHRVYDDPRTLKALEKLGEFLLIAQFPEPQPGWAQQYSAEMHPIWARAFEPPAVSGRESEDAMLALLKIADYTKDQRFTVPIVAGVKYLEQSLLPDGKLARYYELESNRPLYMIRGSGKGYELTHDDSNLPDHYGWKNPVQLPLIKDAYRAILAGRPMSEVTDPAPVDAAEVERILKSLDSNGRWITVHQNSGTRLVGQPEFEEGESYLSSAVFAENLNTLSRYLAGNQ